MLDYLGIVDDTGTLFDESETVCTLHSFLIVYFGNANSSADQRRTVDSFPAKTGGNVIGRDPCGTSGRDTSIDAWPMAEARRN